MKDNEKFEGFKNLLDENERKYGKEVRRNMVKKR